MNNRHRRVAKLKKQELNTAKAKFESEYGVSVEQAIELVDIFVKTVAETVGTIFQNIGKAFCNIGTILSNVNNAKEENNDYQYYFSRNHLNSASKYCKPTSRTKTFETRKPINEKHVTKTESSFFDELDKYK